MNVKITLALRIMIAVILVQHLSFKFLTHQNSVYIFLKLN